MITKISTLSKFQNKTIRVISSLVIALAMVFSSMAFVDYSVRAEDNSTLAIYKEYSGGCQQWPMNSNQYQTVSTGNGFRAVYVEEGGNSTNKYLYVFAAENDYINTGDVTNTNDGCPAYGVANIVIETEYGTFKLSPSWTQYDPSSGFEVHKAESNLDVTWSMKSGYLQSYFSGDNIKTALYYAFGPGSGSNNSNSYGEIKDLAYSTQIVGSGGNLTGDSNVDIITWYPYWDTNENIAINWDMEIEVLPASYTDVTQQGLLMKTSQDVTIDYTSGVNIYNGAYSNGTVKVTWGQMKQYLAGKFQGFGNLFSWFDGQYWNKIGWVYRARFTDPDNNYTSEWQYVYTVTSSSGTGVEDILDPNTGTGLPDFYQNVNDSYNQTFNNTAIANNNYNQVFYVNNAPYVVNPSEEPEDNTTNDILEEILRVTIQIRQLIQQDQNDGDEHDPEDTGLKDKDDELHDREQELIDDMDDKLQDIDTDVELISNNGFLAAANWVRAQYDHLTLNTPFELVIVFALVLGIALIFIGKVR